MPRCPKCTAAGACADEAGRPRQAPGLNFRVWILWVSQATGCPSRRLGRRAIRGSAPTPGSKDRPADRGATIFSATARSSIVARVAGLDGRSQFYSLRRRGTAAPELRDRHSRPATSCAAKKTPPRRRAAAAPPAARAIRAVVAHGVQGACATPAGAARVRLARAGPTHRAGEPDAHPGCRASETAAYGAASRNGASNPYISRRRLRFTHSAALTTCASSPSANQKLNDMLTSSDRTWCHQRDGR